MDHHRECNHTNCAHSTTSSVCQTLSEMDWERGMWNAAFNNDKERVQALIDKARDVQAAVNARDNAGYTALHYAARNGHADLCKVLINNGAHVDALTKSGRATPLHKAALAGKISTVKLLIESGAIVDLQDEDGQTAMHKACDNKHLELANVLLEACPNLNQVKDKKGSFPIM